MRHVAEVVGRIAVDRRRPRSVVGNVAVVMFLFVSRWRSAGRRPWRCRRVCFLLAVVLWC
jgi:hypothetical protein